MRRSRILQKGAKYHVCARINKGELIFESDEIKNLFLDIVKRAKKKYKFSLENFVIMNNHIHFIIKPGENESLSRIMQWILSVFAMYYNGIHKLKQAHVWGSRFWSKIIDDIKQFIDTFNYILGRISNNINRIKFNHSILSNCVENKNFDTDFFATKLHDLRGF